MFPGTKCAWKQQLYGTTYLSDDSAPTGLLIGLRVAMKRPTNTVFVLVFKLERFVEQLSTIARYRKLWIVPGPPPTHLVGTQEMDAQTFIEKVVNVADQGVLIELESHLVEELRTQLDEWKRIK